MEEKKFFKFIPYPFSEQEEKELKEEILSSLPEKRYNFFPKLVFAFALVLLVISIPFLKSKKEDKIKITNKLEILNPLKVKIEDDLAKAFLPQIPEIKEIKVEDIPFSIKKEDHYVKLEWQPMGALKYRVKKCTLFPENNCIYIEETNKNYFLDKEKEKNKLIVYIVEAIKG